MKTLKLLSTAFITLLLIANSNLYAFTSSGDKAINSLVSEYFVLKDALVKSDAAGAKKAATAMQDALKKVQSTDNETKNLIAGISSGLEELVKSTKLNDQRKFFQPVSENLYNLIKKMKPEQTIFRQYCPMAFGNKGGYWLSAEKNIMNPYYGDAMLKCGKVVETID